MKATTIAAAIVAIAALIVGGWYLFNRGNSAFEASTPQPGTTTPSPSSPPSASGSCLPVADLPQALTIEYRNNLFFAEGATEPSTVFCVPRGGTVIFTGSNLWIASDPHPTHTDLSGFDALGARSSYSYTFNQTGEWGFHNHLRATDTGTIIVVE
jgi:hypothetical protein